MQKKQTRKNESELVSKKLSEEEFKKEVIGLADNGLTSEKIGEELRKQNIHSKEYGKKISKILKEENKYVIPDIKNIQTRLENLKRHHEKNKQDKRAMREKERIFSKLRKLKKYHKVD